MKLKQLYTSTVLTWLQLVILGSLLLYWCRALFIPLSFGLLIAIILYPVCSWLEKHKWPRSLAVLLSLLIVIVLFGGLVWLLIWQLGYLKQDIPALSEKLKNAWYQFQQRFNATIGASLQLDDNWLTRITSKAGESSGSLLKSTVNELSSFIFSLFIIPVFSALFLYHRKQFVKALLSFFPSEKHPYIHAIIHKTTYTYFRYIVGLLKVYIIVGILNSTGLLLLGIPHAILFGMLTAFMTMIPYAGITVSSLLPLTAAWLTTDSIWYPIMVVAIFAFVQYLETSIIFPKAVGKELNVSTWAILVALIAGGILWGVSGMILFMPLVAILKIISDDVKEWKPLNLLLGRAEEK